MLDFDWYQGTLVGVDNPDLVTPLLVLGSGALALSPGNGGFNRPLSLRGAGSDGGSIGVYFGDGLDVHVVSSGALAAHTRQVLQDNFPSHRVSRADVAYDVDEPGAFDRLYKTAHFLARKPRRGGRGVLVTSTVGDWLDGEAGRTLYIGAPSSVLRVRIYEKGHEQRAKHPDKTFSLDWCRVEWQIRPNTAGKLLAASSTAEQLAAWTPFGAEMLQAVLALQLVPTAPARVPSTDPEYWLGRQYGKILRELVTLPDYELRNRLLSILELAESTPERFTPPPAGSENLPAPSLVGARG